MTRVHYFSFYLLPGMEDRREANPASFTKVETIKRAALESGAEVRVVSTAIARPGQRFLRREVIEVGAGETHVYLPSVRLPGRLLFPVTLVFLWAQVVLYLLREVKRGDRVLVYHSLNYMRPFTLARRLRRFPLVVEFNELYSAVTRRDFGKRAAEERFVHAADAHLFMNTIAAAEFADGKPYAINHGTYHVPARERPRADGGRTHVVYAGILDWRRAAELLAEAAVHLDDGHAVHILGFGPDEAADRLRAVIADVNEQTRREAVIFHGQRRGRELTDFLHGCHIGVSSHRYLPEEMDAARYTFPSKVPTYMAHDLRVVCADIPVVVQSPFAEFTTFYSEHTPEAIAEAIRAAAKDLGDAARTPATLVAELDAAFRRDIAAVLAT